MGRKLCFIVKMHLSKNARTQLEANHVKFYELLISCIDIRHSVYEASSKVAHDSLGDSCSTSSDISEKLKEIDENERQKRKRKKHKPIKVTVSKVRNKLFKLSPEL